MSDDRREFDPAGDPPVVARLIVEIRSDGSRTVARGAIEDLASGHRTSVEARGTTPLALAGALVRALLDLPVARLATGALQRRRSRDARPLPTSSDD